MYTIRSKTHGKVTGYGFGRFTKITLAIIYRQSQKDYTLFIKHSNSGGTTTIIMYVDDIIVTGNDVKEKTVQLMSSQRI